MAPSKTKFKLSNNSPGSADANEQLLNTIKETIREEMQGVIDAVRLENKVIIDQIYEENNVLRGEIKVLIEAMAEQTDILKRLQGQQFDDDSLRNKFPLQCIEDIVALEEIMSVENANSYIRVIRSLLSSDSFNRSLRKVLGDDVIMACNVDGVQGKMALKGFKQFFDALIVSIPTNSEFESPEKQLRAALKQQKNRICKAQAPSNKSISNMISEYSC